MYEDFSVIVLLALGAAGTIVLLLCITIFPKMIVDRRVSDTSEDNFSVAERLKAENDARTTLIQAVGGAALLIGVFFTWSQLQISQQSQISERFSRAVEQMSNEKSRDTRLGGIHTLEQIARDSKSDRKMIAQVLSTYIRTRSPWTTPKPSKGKKTLGTTDCPGRTIPESVENLESLFSRAVDVEAAASALTRRPIRRDASGSDYALLPMVDLRLAFLPDAHLERADLRGIHLERANLRFAQLQEARLDPWDCNSHLEYADLEGADLSAAQLQGVDFYGARLVGANLSGANVDGAQFTGVIADSDTKWPRGFNPAKAGVQIVGG